MKIKSIFLITILTMNTMFSMGLVMDKTTEDDNYSIQVDTDVADIINLESEYNCSDQSINMNLRFPKIKTFDDILSFLFPGGGDKAEIIEELKNYVSLNMMMDTLARILVVFEDAMAKKNTEYTSLMYGNVKNCIENATSEVAGFKIEIPMDVEIGSGVALGKIYKLFACTMTITSQIDSNPEFQKQYEQALKRIRHTFYKILNESFDLNNMLPQECIDLKAAKEKGEIKDIQLLEEYFKNIIQTNQIQILKKYDASFSSNKSDDGAENPYVKPENSFAQNINVIRKPYLKGYLDLEVEDYIDYYKYIQYTPIIFSQYYGQQTSNTPIEDNLNVNNYFDDFVLDYLKEYDFNENKIATIKSYLKKITNVKEINLENFMLLQYLNIYNNQNISMFSLDYINYIKFLIENNYIVFDLSNNILKNNKTLFKDELGQMYFENGSVVKRLENEFINTESNNEYVVKKQEIIKIIDNIIENYKTSKYINSNSNASIYYKIIKEIYDNKYNKKILETLNYYKDFQIDGANLSSISSRKLFEIKYLQEYIFGLKYTYLSKQWLDNIEILNQKSLVSENDLSVNISNSDLQKIIENGKYSLNMYINILEPISPIKYLQYLNELQFNFIHLQNLFVNTGDSKIITYLDIIQDDNLIRNLNFANENKNKENIEYYKLNNISKIEDNFGTNKSSINYLFNLTQKEIDKLVIYDDTFIEYIPNKLYVDDIRILSNLIADIKEKIGEYVLNKYSLKYQKIKEKIEIDNEEILKKMSQNIKTKSLLEKEIENNARLLKSIEHEYNIKVNTINRLLENKLLIN